MVWFRFHGNENCLTFQVKRLRRRCSRCPQQPGVRWHSPLPAPTSGDFICTAPSKPRLQPTADFSFPVSICPGVDSGRWAGRPSCTCRAAIFSLDLLGLPYPTVNHPHRFLSIISLTTSPIWHNSLLAKPKVSLIMQRLLQLGGSAVVVELNDLKGLLQPKWIYESMITYSSI